MKKEFETLLNEDYVNLRPFLRLLNENYVNLRPFLKVQIL